MCKKALEGPHLVHDYMRYATKVIPSTESSEQDTSCAEKQFRLLSQFTFPAYDVAHRTVVQTLCMHARRYRNGRNPSRLCYEDVCT